MEWKIFDNKCWWCESPDLSEEHKYKRTDLERGYFSASSEQKIVLCSLSDLTQKGKIIQGPKSKTVKFKASLCQNCNNANSQPFDESYDKLIKFLKDNETNTLKAPSIKLANIYGENFGQQAQNLAKYFVKHLGCTLTDANISVPLNLIDFLNDKIELNNIELVISQSIDRKEYLDIVSEQIPNSSWIGCSDIQVEYNKKTNTINFLKYELYYRSFSFYINLNTNIDGLKTNIISDTIDLILYHEQNFNDLNTKEKTTTA